MSVEKKTAKIVHKDGGHSLHVTAQVRAGDFVFPYSAHHPAHHTVDHDAILTALDAKLAHRATLLTGIFALIGAHGAVDGVPYEVTEANIRVHSPAKFELFIRWTETHGGEEISKSRSVIVSGPSECEAPSQLLAAVEADIAATASMLAEARRRATAFSSGGQ